MSMGTVMILNYVLDKTTTLGTLCSLLNSESDALDKVWFHNQPRQNRFGNSTPFWVKVEEKWRWNISIGDKNTITSEPPVVDYKWLAANSDWPDVTSDTPVESDWPELNTPYGFMTVVFPDCLCIFVPIKWGRLMNSIQEQIALKAMAACLSKLLHSQEILIVDEPLVESDIFVDLNTLKFS